MAGNGLGPEGVYCLSPAFMRLHCITYLNLSGLVSNIAPSFTSSMSLNRKRHGISWLGVFGLLALRVEVPDPSRSLLCEPFLFAAETCDSLYITDNNLGAIGVLALAQVLLEVLGIEHLDISGNVLGLEGIRVIAPIIGKMSKLRVLALAGLLLTSLCYSLPSFGDLDNNIGTESAPAIVLIIMGCISLRRLDVSG